MQETQRHDRSMDDKKYLWNPVGVLKWKEENKIWWPPLQWHVHSKIRIAGLEVYRMIHGLGEEIELDAADIEVIETVHLALLNKEFVDSKGIMHRLTHDDLLILGGKIFYSRQERLNAKQ